MLKKREYIFWIAMFCGLTLLLLSFGTVYDLQIDGALYNPANRFADKRGFSQKGRTFRKSKGGTFPNCRHRLRRRIFGAWIFQLAKAD